MDNGNNQMNYQSQNNYMVCPNCNQYILYGSAFCNYCGFRFQYQQSYPQQSKKIPYISVGLVIGIISTVMVIISTFLPYIKISALGYNQTMSIVRSEFGKLVIFLAVCAIITASLKTGIPTTIIGILMSVISIMKMFDFEDYVSDLVIDGFDMSGFVSKGSGCYMMLIFSIFVLISGVILIIEKASNKE